VGAEAIMKTDHLLKIGGARKVRLRRDRKWVRHMKERAFHLICVLRLKLRKGERGGRREMNKVEIYQNSLYSRK